MIFCRLQVLEQNRIYVSHILLLILTQTDSVFTEVLFYQFQCPIELQSSFTCVTFFNHLHHFSDVQA